MLKLRHLLCLLSLHRESVYFQVNTGAGAKQITHSIVMYWVYIISILNL